MGALEGIDAFDDEDEILEVHGLLEKDSCTYVRKKRPF